jgi:hypothetical protein
MADRKGIRGAICDWGLIAFLPLSVLLMLALIGCFNDWHPLITSPNSCIAIWASANLSYVSTQAILSFWLGDHGK